MKQFRYLIVTLLLLPILTFIVACQGDDDNEDVGGGICVHEYEDPLVTIASAQEANTQFPLSQIHIDNIRLEGNLINLNNFSQENITNLSLDPDGNGGYCTIPCAFLEGEGQVSFNVSANGYQTRTITFEGEYENLEGSCPSFSSGGVMLNLEFTPVN